MKCNAEAPNASHDSAINDRSVATNAVELAELFQGILGQMNAFSYHSPCDTAYGEIGKPVSDETNADWWEALAKKLEIAAWVSNLKGPKGIPTGIIKSVVSRPRQDPRTPMIERLTENQRAALEATNDPNVKIKDVAPKFGMKPRDLKNLRQLVKLQQRPDGEQIVVNKKTGKKPANGGRPARPPKPLGSAGWEAFENEIKAGRARGSGAK